MKFAYFCFFACLLMLISKIDARSKRNKPKSKTKTKWSSTTDLLPNGENPLLTSEEHGYYVKRTFVAPDGTLRTNITEDTSVMKSVPYLAIPIAWFQCPTGSVCRNGFSALFNTNLNAISEGFLCDDDCAEPYNPICGRTETEVAVFYNQCKLNVAKCRTHGYWTDYTYEECKKAYPKEVKYTEEKFRASPFFKNKTMENVFEKEKPVLNMENSEIVKKASKVSDEIENESSKIEAIKNLSPNLKLKP